MSFSIETITLLAPAFVAGAIISIAHVPLGQEVLKRGIIFLDLAVAQCAALGMIAFQVLLNIDEHSYLGIYGPLASGIIAALTCSVIFHILEKYARQYQEALIGCAFVLTASLSILLMANDPHGGEEMTNILAGQILWVDWSDIKIIAPVFILIFAVWMIFQKKRKLIFYPIFALTIPFSVKIIGVYLVFSSLIFPALAVINAKNKKIMYGLIVSLTAYALGLLTSYIFDWPSGPAIILMMALCSFLFSLYQRNYKTNKKK